MAHLGAAPPLAYLGAPTAVRRLCCVSPVECRAVYRTVYEYVWRRVRELAVTGLYRGASTRTCIRSLELTIAMRKIADAVYCTDLSGVCVIALSI